MFKTLPDIKEYDFNIYPKSNIYKNHILLYQVMF